MSSYTVLARKYRPQTFADLVGQQHVAVTLRNAIMQNRVAHAFLFTGSRGVGKTSSARIFAKALNCAHAPCEEPCNECASCLEITKGQSLDVIEMDAASNRGIDSMRDILDGVSYAPSRDRYKIYIIDEVHMLTTEAFNALLKTLEEPPSHVIFILATTDPNKVPVTILSRCQRYDFKRIGIEDLVAHLSKIAKAENIAFEDSALRLIARTARGGARDALSAMDQIIAFAEQPITDERAAEVLGVASRETLMKMGEALVKKDVPGALACIERVEHYGQNLSLFAFDLLEFLRDMTVMASAPDAEVPVELSASEQAGIKSWLGLTSQDRLQRIFQIWYQTSELLPKSLSPRLVMEMAAIRMCQVETVVPIDGILRKLDAITRALNGNLNLAPDALAHIQAYISAQSPDVVLNAGPDEKKNAELSPICPPKPADSNSPFFHEGEVSPCAAISPARPPSTPEPGRTDDAESGAQAARTQEEITGSASGTHEENGQKGEQNTPTTPSDEAPGTPKEEPTAVVSQPPVCGSLQNHGPSGGRQANDPGHAQPEPPPADEGWELLADDDSEDISDWDPDNDEDDSGEEGGFEHDCVQKNEKTLEVSEDRLKNAPLVSRGGTPELDALHRWKRVVLNLTAPLSTIMSKAQVASFTDVCVEAALPLAYKDIIKPDHIREVERHLSILNQQTCDLKLSFAELGDDADTLAALDARAQLEMQQQAIEKAKNSPGLRAICGILGIDNDTIRFTFNQDRTSS